MDFRAPELLEVLDQIKAVRNKDGDDCLPIGDWRSRYTDAVSTNRNQPDISIFNSFVNNLLERGALSQAFYHRLPKFQEKFHSYDDISESSVRDVFRTLANEKHGYRWGVESATKVVLEAKHTAMDPGFTWRLYVQQAEDRYEDDFPEDKFRRIRGVGFKTRDLALSALSNRFVAIDLHVVRVTSRIGLLLYGYGDPEITTAVSQESGYLFFHRLILKLARRTGWPEAPGYSPGEIDRMLWHFGRAMCRDTPKCSECPIKNVCLTNVRHSTGS